MPEEYAKLYWYDNKEEYEKFINNLAPIVLFTYNRLEHTKKTIEALQQNVFAKESRLFIYSDAPKNEGAVDSVQSVREYLHTVDGFKEIIITERETNWGLAENIIDGVTSIVNKYGKIIVLEDDIVTSKYFLKYMNDALEVYKDEDSVMAVSGFFEPTDEGRDILLDTFFFPWFYCWGWATWKRSWDKFERNPQKLNVIVTQEQKDWINFDNCYNMWAQVEGNIAGKIYTWAIFFYCCIVLNKGMVLCSKYNYCVNNGIDGTGENCGISEIYQRSLSGKRNVCFLKNPILSMEAIDFAKSFYKRINTKDSIFVRIYKCYLKHGVFGVVKKIVKKYRLYLL